MDVVAAIDAWIDEQIDELSDDELEWVLELLDVVAVSAFSQQEPDEISAGDVAEMAELAGNSNGTTERAEAILRAAILGESVDLDVVFGAGADPAASESGDLAESASVEGDADRLFRAFTDEELEQAGQLGGDADPADEPADQPADEPAPLFTSAASSNGDPGADQDSLLLEADDDPVPVSDPPARTGDEDFLTDLAHAERTDEVAIVSAAATTERATTERVAALPDWVTSVQPVPLAAHDALGPSFLPEPDGPPPGTGIGARHVILPVLLIAGLALFGLGMMRLIDSLDGDAEVATDTTAATTPAPSVAPTPAPTAVAATPEQAADPAAATAATADGDSVDEATAPPLGRLALRLVTGEVVLLTDDPAGPPSATSLYEVDEDRPPARTVTWGDFGIAVADSSGDVVVIDPDDVGEPLVVFRADDELGEAVALATIPGQVVILTDLGTIMLVGADPDSGTGDIEVIWDATPDPATAIGSVGDMVPFLLENGDARLIATDADASAITIWLSGVEPPARALEGVDDSVLLGIGEGSIVRYRVGDIDGDRLEPVWEPSTSGRQPAFSYHGVGEDVAIVLADGSVVFADSDPTDEPLWDPSETEIRAFSISGDKDQLTVLLEIGSIVRILSGEDTVIESVWDITDQTRAPANQFVVDPHQ